MGDTMMKEHGSRITWWITLIVALIGVILVGMLAGKLEDPVTGAAGAPNQFNTLTPSPWISPTGRSLAALIGIALVLDTYTNYMVAHAKGLLDRYPGQYMLGMFMKVVLWVLVPYALWKGGTIGAAFALYTLAVMTVWTIMTSHSYSPFHTWLSVLELVFIIFLIVWLSIANAKMFPEP